MKNVCIYTEKNEVFELKDSEISHKPNKVAVKFSQHEDIDTSSNYTQQASREVWKGQNLCSDKV